MHLDHNLFLVALLLARLVALKFHLALQPARTADRQLVVEVVPEHGRFKVFANHRDAVEQGILFVQFDVGRLPSPNGQSVANISMFSLYGSILLTIEDGQSK